MKIIHTSDWHLGKLLYEYSMIEDQRSFIFNTFLASVKTHSPDAIIIAGDIFDRQIAPIEAINLFDELISKLCEELKTKVIIIAGNHDSPERLAVANKLLKNSGLYIYKRMDISVEPVKVTQGDLTVNIYPLPYFEPSEARVVLNRENIRGFNEAYVAVMDAIRSGIDPSEVNILAAHCFVTGCSTSGSENIMSVGGASEVGKEAFIGFDYVALGHLHGRQQVADNIRYCGTPLKYSFDEAGHKKSVTLIDINQKGGIDISEIEIIPPRNMRIIEGKFDDLLKAAVEDNSKDDYIQVRLSDNFAVLEPRMRLNAVGYTHILSVINSGILKAGSEEREKLRQKLREGKGLDDMEIFCEFMSQICGEEPDEETKAIMAEVMSQ